MTVKELKEALSRYPDSDDYDVIVALEHYWGNACQVYVTSYVEDDNKTHMAISIAGL